jgi:hypothetical protein
MTLHCLNTSSQDRHERHDGRWFGRQEEGVFAISKGWPAICCSPEAQEPLAVNVLWSGINLRLSRLRNPILKIA